MKASLDLQLKRDALHDNGDTSAGLLTNMYGQGPEGVLARPSSLPGILQTAHCHCQACCSCSPIHQNCFIPTFSLSRMVQSTSLDAGVNYSSSSDIPSSSLRKSFTDVSRDEIDVEILEKPERANVMHCSRSELQMNCRLSSVSHGCDLCANSKNLPVPSLTQPCETIGMRERSVAASTYHSQVCCCNLLCSTSGHQSSYLCMQCERCGKLCRTQSATNPKLLLEFKQKLQTMRSWFRGFSDTQKNTILQALMEESHAPQKHLLATKFEFYSHDECQPNCRDLIGWLPDMVSVIIFSFLDPVSLCRASCVNQRWNQIANDQSVWRCLCSLNKWRLSQAGEQKQIVSYKLPDGTVNWKGLFAERFRLQNNWIKGRCNIRTFEGHTQGVSCLQFDENRIVSGSSDKTIKLWNIRTNSQWHVQTLVGHSGTVRCLHLDGNRLVSGSTDRTIKVWDLSSQQSWASIACKVTMVGHIDTVRCLKVDADKVISGSYDKTLKVWDIKTGNCRRTLRGHEAAVLCVQFDNTKIISGSCDKTLKVWTFEGYCVMTLQGHQDAVTCLQFDERRIISGSLDCTLRFWNVNNGHHINTIDWKASEGHTRVVRCLQADSWRVVSASDDKTIKVWSLETGQRLVTLRNHTDGVTCLQFNDNILVSGSYDKTVKLWDFSCC